MQSVAVGDSHTNLNATHQHTNENPISLKLGAEEYSYTDHSNEYRAQARNSVQPVLSIQKIDDAERPHPFSKTQM